MRSKAWRILSRAAGGDSIWTRSPSERISGISPSTLVTVSVRPSMPKTRSAIASLPGAKRRVTSSGAWWAHRQGLLERSASTAASKPSAGSKSGVCGFCALISTDPMRSTRKTRCSRFSWHQPTRRQARPRKASPQGSTSRSLRLPGFPSRFGGDSYRMWIRFLRATASASARSFCARPGSPGRTTRSRRAAALPTACVSPASEIFRSACCKSCEKGKSRVASAAAPAA